MFNTRVRDIQLSEGSECSTQSLLIQRERIRVKTGMIKGDAKLTDVKTVIEVDLNDCINNDEDRKLYKNGDTVPAIGSSSLPVPDNDVVIFATGWKDSGSVLTLNTGFNPIGGSVIRRTTPLGNKLVIPAPLCIHIYNKGMGGVDMADRLRGGRYAITDRVITGKWPLKAWTGIYGMLLSNIYIVFSHCTRKGAAVRACDRHHLFMVNLAAQMVAHNKHTTRRSRFVTKTKLPVPQDGVHHCPVKHAHVVRQCVICSTPNHRVRTVYMCQACNVFLCLKCFPLAIEHGGAVDVHIKKKRRRPVVPTDLVRGKRKRSKNNVVIHSGIKYIILFFLYFSFV
jgi:hypothetical protein